MQGRGTEGSVGSVHGGVCFEIGLEAPSFPEKERVSWPLQTPTPNSTAST